MFSSTLIFLILVFFIELSIPVSVNYLLDRRLHHLIKKKDTLDDDQCVPVNFTNGQLGLINVVAFLDSSSAFSYKQAEMLKMLKDRLDHSNMPEILFFAVINDFMDNEDDNEEMKIEELAWMNVAPQEVYDMKAKFEKNSSRSFADTISSHIISIEDNEDLGIWRQLNGSRDKILVIDRCGKLTYEIIVPWSILHFPYVKAAILSTYKDDPCGPCDVVAKVIDFDSAGIEIVDNPEVDAIIRAPEVDDHSRFDHSGDDPQSFDEDLTTLRLGKEDAEFINSEAMESNEFPGLKIIMHAPHYHVNTDATKKHEYLVLEFDKPNYHGHLDVPDYADKPEVKVGHQFQSIFDSVIFVGDESPGFYGEVADFWHENGADDKNNETIQEEEEEEMEALKAEKLDPVVDEDDDVDEDDKAQMLGVNPIAPTSPSAEEALNVSEEVKQNGGKEEIDGSDKLMAHYSKLLPWIYYVLNN